MATDEEWDQGLLASRALRNGLMDDWAAKEKDKHAQAKKYKRRVAHECTYCGKKDTANLRACSLCKSARYCNERCQQADYKARHRAECANFAYPPLTREFLTEPVDGAKYAEKPIFAQGHKEGVGCWVSCDGQVDGNLQALAASLPLPDDIMNGPHHDTSEAAGIERMRAGSRYKAFTRNLITLSVLVQNRRKDKTKVLVFGARTQLVTFGHMSDDIIRGRAEVDKLSTFEYRGRTLAVVGVAEDPWTKQRRVSIKNLTGTNVTASSPLSAVHSADNGIVSLQPGEFVIFNVQFRVGDGDRITEDWHALACLSTLTLEFKLWEQGTDPLLLDGALAQRLGRDGRAPEGLRAVFNHRAMREWYDDLIVHGERTFIKSHYGAERVGVLENTGKMMEVMGKEMTRKMEESGAMDAILAKLRADGMHDMANGLEECRRRTRGG